MECWRAGRLSGNLLLWEELDGESYLVEGIFCQAEELALWVCFPPVANTFYFHTDAVFAAQLREFFFHMRPQLSHQIVRPLVWHKPHTAGKQRALSKSTKEIEGAESKLDCLQGISGQFCKG